METSALSPYRVASRALTPIDSDSIPDFGSAEIAKIKDMLQDNDRRQRRIFCRLHSEIHEAIVIATVGLSSGLLVWLMAIGVLGLGNALFSVLGAFAVSYVFGDDIAASLTGRSMRTHKGALELEVRRPFLQKRLSELRSLERLTGKAERARDLLAEVKRFNDDLENISEMRCSAIDINAVVVRRAELTACISTYRQNLLSSSREEDQNLLNATND